MAGKDKGVAHRAGAREHPAEQKQPEAERPQGQHAGHQQLPRVEPSRLPLAGPVEPDQRGGQELDEAGEIVSHGNCPGRKRRKGL
jgi:hypothetical protein